MGPSSTKLHYRSVRKFSCRRDSILTIVFAYSKPSSDDLLSQTKHCEVWGYDFSVNSMGPQISNSHKHRTHFVKVGLAGTDAFGPEVENKMYTLETLMKMNGKHTSPSAFLFLMCYGFRRPYSHRHSQSRHRILGIRDPKDPRLSLPRCRKALALRSTPTGDPHLEQKL